MADIKDIAREYVTRFNRATNKRQVTKELLDEINSLTFENRFHLIKQQKNSN